MSEPGTVAALGEFGLIALLEQALAEVADSSIVVHLGIGDDAAIWSPTPGTRSLITTDSLLDGVHFRLDWTTWADLGHKALAVNLSDIAAMGGQPRVAVVSLGLTGREPVAGLLDCYRGMGTLAARHGLAVVGGDVVASPDRLGLHVTVVGETWPGMEGRVLSRAGARAGDEIAVGGQLGLAAAGLAVLRSGDRSAAAAPWLAAHARPEPSLALGRVLLEAGATAAMDLSDGLYGDITKICARSGVSARVLLDRLPVPQPIRQHFPGTWLDLATRGGEDYCLVFTAPTEAMRAILARCVETGIETPTVIGDILPRPEDQQLLFARDLSGAEEPVDPGAFDHFLRH